MSCDAGASSTPQVADGPESMPQKLVQAIHDQVTDLPTLLNFSYEISRMYLTLVVNETQSRIAKIAAGSPALQQSQITAPYGERGLTSGPTDSTNSHGSPSDNVDYDDGIPVAKESLNTLENTNGASASTAVNRVIEASESAKASHLLAQLQAGWAEQRRAKHQADTESPAAKRRRLTGKQPGKEQIQKPVGNNGPVAAKRASAQFTVQDGPELELERGGARVERQSSRRDTHAQNIGPKASVIDTPSAVTARQSVRNLMRLTSPSHRPKHRKSG